MAHMWTIIVREKQKQSPLKENIHHQSTIKNIVTLLKIPLPACTSCHMYLDVHVSMLVRASCSVSCYAASFIYICLISITTNKPNTCI